MSKLGFRLGMLRDLDHSGTAAATFFSFFRDYFPYMLGTPPHMLGTPTELYGIAHAPGDMLRLVPMLIGC